MFHNELMDNIFSKKKCEYNDLFTEFNLINKRLERDNHKIATQLIECTKHLSDLKKMQQECINNFYIIAKNINNNNITDEF